MLLYECRTFKEFKVRLKSYECVQEGQKKQQNRENSRNANINEMVKVNKQNNRVRSRFYYCGDYNHNAGKCLAKAEGPKLYTCKGERGHKSTSCPKKCMTITKTFKNRNQRLVL